MVRMEDFTKCNSTGLLGSGRHDMTVLRRPSCAVVYGGTRSHGHPLEALVYTMRISTPLNNSEGNAVSNRIGYLIVGMNQVDNIETI